MSMRRLIDLVEAKAKQEDDPRLDHALWWLQRWISGSMTDPDWEWAEAEGMTLEQAFTIIGQTVGNKRAISKPVLWRCIVVSKAMATKIKRSMLLPPSPKFSYQSFSGKRDVAEEFGVEHRPNGSVALLVSISPDPKIIPFGMADLKASKNGKVDSYIASLTDWHHQDEVLVHVTQPLPLLSAEIIQ